MGNDSANDKTGLVKMSLFGLEAIVLAENALFDLIDQAGRFERRSAGFHEKFILVFAYSI